MPGTDTVIEISPRILEQIDSLDEDRGQVILFNDDWHPFDQVIHQLQKATGCSEMDAEMIAYEAHTTGRAVCFEGGMYECKRVAGILEIIDLGVKIEPL